MTYTHPPVSERATAEGSESEGGGAGRGVLPPALLTALRIGSARGWLSSRSNKNRSATLGLSSSWEHVHSGALGVSCMARSGVPVYLQSGLGGYCYHHFIVG